MTEDEQVALLKRHWGIETKTVGVFPLLPLFRLIANSYKTVGVLQTVALLGDDPKMRLEAERIERVMGMAIDDLTR